MRLNWELVYFWDVDGGVVGLVPPARIRSRIVTDEDSMMFGLSSTFSGAALAAAVVLSYRLVNTAG